MGYNIWRVKDIVEVVKGQQENKFDSIIVIDGNRGLGKSTLAWKIAKKKKGFRPNRDILFSREEVLKHISTRKRAVIVADEMINVTYNRDFFSEEQKKILKVLNMYRDSENVLIACVPKFSDLDRQFRNLVKMRLNVCRRGMAIIHTQNQSTYASDVWDMKLNEKIEANWLKKKIHKPKYSSLTTYRGVLRFVDLGSKERNVYEEIKERKRNTLSKAKEEVTGNISFLDRTYNLIKEGKIKKEELPIICLGQSNMSFPSLDRALRMKAQADRTTLGNLFKVGEDKSVSLFTSKNPNPTDFPVQT